MNNMYDILARLNSVGQTPLNEDMAAPVVKTAQGFAATAPKGKQLQTTLPKDRPLRPTDVRVKEQMSNQQMLQQMTGDMLKKAMRDTGMLDKEPDASAKPPMKIDIDGVGTTGKQQANPLEPGMPGKPDRQAPMKIDINGVGTAGNQDPAKGAVDYSLTGSKRQDTKEADGFPHRSSPTFGSSRSMQPGFDPTFTSPIGSGANSEIEELEYLMSKGAMTGQEQNRLYALYRKFGIRRPEDMEKLPQLRQQELARIEKLQQDLQRQSAEANVASRDELERQRAAKMGVTPRPQSAVGNDAQFRAAYDRAGQVQPAVREDQELEEAAFQFSPEQEKFLGNANRQDPYILARMPGPKPPVSYFTDPEDRAIAQRMNFGQQNLNRIKDLVGAKPGDAEMFATGKPATPTDVSTTAGFRKAYDQAGKPVGGQTPAPKAPPVISTPSVPGKGPVAAKKTAGQGFMVDRGTTYQIKPGDTLTRIAAKNGTTVQAIMAANPQIQDANRIQAGAQLTLPVSPAAGALPGKAVAGGGNIGDTAMAEADVDEGNEFVKTRLDAIKAGKPTFRMNGKVYRVTGDTSDEQRMDEGFIDFMDKKAKYRDIGADVEGRADDYTVTFRDGSRKRYQEMAGRRKVTTLEPVDAAEPQDDEGNVVQRGRGRPKGSKRAIGAKGPTGRSKLLRMAEDDNGIRDDLAYEIEQILDGAIEGTDQTDHIIDELGDLYDRIESSGDKVALKAYSMMNGSIDQGTNAQVRAAQMALKRLKQGMSEGITALAEGHFAVGDKVRCKKSGMTGEIIKMDKAQGDQDEKYYTFRRSDGKVIKKAPNELTAMANEGMPQALRKYVPGYAKRELDKKMDAQAYEKGDSIKKTVDKDVNFGRYKKLADKLKKGVAEDYDRDEYDEEGEMAKSQARTIENAAQELQSILADDENLPEWVQVKITLALDYIDTARDYMKANRPDNGMMAEKAVSKAQRAAAGIARAAQKGEIPRSKLQPASRAMADMPAKELRKFAKTKEKGLPEKVKEEDELDEVSKSKLGGYVRKAMDDEQQTRKQADAAGKSSKEAGKDFMKDRQDVLTRQADKRKTGIDRAITKLSKEDVDETTVSGSVATSDATPKAKKGAMQFGKGVYESQIAESFERKLNMLTEGMNINMSMDEHGKKSLTVNATDEDAEQLADILKMAGLGGHAGSSVCGVCGGRGMHEHGCDQQDMMEHELANSPDPSYAALGSTRDYGLAGGVNGPKLQSNPNNPGDNPLAMSRMGKHAGPSLNLGAVVEDIKQQTHTRLMDLYKSIS